MSERYQPEKWPDDTSERIASMRNNGGRWADVALSFGVSVPTIRYEAEKRGLLIPRALRYFTPEEDAIIRTDYIANVDLKFTAAKLNRTYGDIRQRIFHHNKDLLKTVRSSHGSKAIKRYGFEVLALGATSAEAAEAMKKKLVIAKATAKASAINAKTERKNFIIKTMMDQIASGRERNLAIFEARSLGVTLEDLSKQFDITRERIRQICDETALKMAIELPSEQNQPPSRDWLVVSDGKP